MAEPLPCAIWNTETIIGEHNFYSDGYTFDSPRAGGRYCITEFAKAKLQSVGDDSVKARLTSWLMNQRWAGNATPEITNGVLDIVANYPSKNTTMRRDDLIKFIAEKTPQLGQFIQLVECKNDELIDRKRRISQSPEWILIHHHEILAATESLSIKEVHELLKFSKSQNLVSNSPQNISLTFEGRAFAEQQKNPHGETSQGFVAMWFGEEVNEAYHQGIAPAIEDAGYKPFRIDQKEHNNKIDDEIIAEIRRSRFVVADFTCGTIEQNNKKTPIPRGGVYYEAGFAQGLNIPVIWCCREDQIGDVHFDTRQFNHITWVSPEDLRKKLKNRINAVLGDGPLLKR